MSELKNRHDIIESQCQYVAKGNDLIQKSRYSLSLLEQKTILYLISKIKPNDENGTWYSFNIRDFCKVCNMDMTGGVYYSYVKKIIENIASYVIWLPMEDSKGKKSEYMTHWIQKARIIEDGTFSVQFDDDLKPYLFNLKSFYTMYNLEYVLGMRSKYGLRLYELLISHKNHAITIRFSLDELRERMDCENYKAYADFRIKALEPAIKDINDVSDIEVKYKAIKTGRSVSHIEFSMMYATDDFLRHMERTVRLGYDKKD